MLFSGYVPNTYFILLGVISTLGQAVLLREITTIFYGNELFYGLGLGAWFFFTGLGSLFSYKIKILKNKPYLLWIGLFGQGILLPLLVVFLRYLVAHFIPSGQLPSLRFSLFILFPTFFVFCFPLGAGFTLASDIWQKRRSREVVNLGYFWETIGFITAGTIFSFVLSTTSFPLFAELDFKTLQWRYPNLVEAVYSRHNQLLVSQSDKQRNYIVGGQLAFTTGDTFETEQFLSLIWPFVEKENKVLVLGSPNIVRSLQEKFSFQRIDFLEIDDKQLELEKSILANDINLILTDPRRFLNTTDEKWDLIIYSVGNPQTLLTNRYYTEESFLQVKNHLEGNGVFVLAFYLPIDYLSKEAILTGGSIYQTLKKVFPHIVLLTPEEQVLLVSSGSNLLVNEEKINPHWHDYFWFHFRSSKRADILDKLSKADVKINTDFEPVTFFYQQLFWQTTFSFKAPEYIQKISSIFPSILAFVLFFYLIKTKKRGHLGILVGCSSFILMSLETLLIFVYQTKIGYLYSQISLVFALVLLGMACGVTVEKFIKKSLLALRAGFVGFLIVLFLFEILIDKNLAGIPYIWWIVAFLIGFVGGMLFAIINTLYLKKHNNPGYIYAYDLFGAFLGAVLTSAFVLPVFGMYGLVLILVSVIIASLLSIQFSKQ